MSLNKFTCLSNLSQDLPGWASQRTNVRKKWRKIEQIIEIWGIIEEVFFSSPPGNERLAIRPCSKPVLGSHWAYNVASAHKIRGNFDFKKHIRLEFTPSPRPQLHPINNNFFLGLAIIFCFCVLQEKLKTGNTKLPETWTNYSIKSTMRKWLALDWSLILKSEMVLLDPGCKQNNV